MQKVDEYITAPLEIERELLLLFARVDPLVIFDIGACEGEDSIRYSRLFPNATVYAFEPRIDNARNARTNIEKYQCSSVYVIEEALSDEIGSATFHLSSGRPENATDDNWDQYNKSSSLLAPEIKEMQKHWPCLKFNQTIEVRTNTLRNFCVASGIEKIDFIHLDVQGAELKVLEGAGTLMEKIKSVWMEVEIVSLYKEQPLRDEVESFMAENGFVRMIEHEAMANIYVDQLYINTRFFPDIKVDSVGAIRRLSRLFLKLKQKFLGQ